MSTALPAIGSYSRRALVRRFAPTSLDLGQGSPGSYPRCRLSVDLVHECGQNITKVLANILAGQHVSSDFATAADSFHLLGEHFSALHLDRHFDLLLPASNSQQTLTYPSGFEAQLRTHNSAARLSALPNPTLPTGESYTSMLKSIRGKGMSAAFFSHGQAFRMLAHITPSTSTATIVSTSYHPSSLFHSASFCGITKKDACQALAAIAGAGDSLTAPFLVLCTLGGLAAVIGLVVETDGLAAPEAAELYAEAEEVCAALDSKTLAGVSGIITWLQRMLC